MRTDGIIAAGLDNKHLFPGEWPSGKATDFELMAPGNGKSLSVCREMENTPPATATGMDWAFAPDWLTLEEACFLSGHDRGTMLSIVDEDGVDLNTEGLIEKRSLWEFQTTLAEVLHGVWG
jgi:hypothetical protein